MDLLMSAHIRFVGWLGIQFGDDDSGAAIADSAWTRQLFSSTVRSWIRLS